MRETFKASLSKKQILLGFLRCFLHPDQIAALFQITQELRRRTREETVFTLEMPTVVSDNLEACQSSGLFYSQTKMQLEVRQETSVTSPNHRLHACLHHPTHPGLKSGRHHLGEPTMALPKHKLCCPWANGRQDL